jgi:glycine/serine hydroxymethyltransferase
MAVFGHSASQAPQLLHSSLIINDMDALLLLRAAHRAGLVETANHRRRL